ncbi:hypothetical protein N7450_001322 [Penicillium hetheringtonii]|uniref:DDE-1 domain-containing protein n=1 Tax=Penicillium hetheringtonii TaxID=911720 RepID=A0AAD6H3F0_9EURO|nr:hypothetical protein N7450_001322 [Penicillium hetheringtonii]
MIVQYIIDKNGIQSENIYNFDETGFAMDLISVQKNIIVDILFYNQRTVNELLLLKQSMQIAICYCYI